MIGSLQLTLHAISSTSILCTLLSFVTCLLSSAVLCIYASIGLLQKNPAKRLNWPHLLEHPFVRETELDRDQQRIEKSHYLQCGGFGGPRERLEVIMVRRAAVCDHLR